MYCYKKVSVKMYLHLFDLILGRNIDAEVMADRGFVKFEESREGKAKIYKIERNKKARILNLLK